MTTPPNFTKGIGRIALDRYDFQSHINGSNFRQNATTIDVANPNLVYGSPTTVEQALEDLNNFIITQINNGVGFSVVGDGYNTYHNANGTINFDPAIPSLDTILNPIFSAIINNTTLPSGFERIKFGGIILIKAGTYIVKNTITVPSGITLLGEGYGTKIVNATSLDFSGSPPPVPVKIAPGTEAPIFSILADGYRSTNDAAVDPNMFMFSRETRLMNMVIADNFVEPTLLGDTYYKLPQNQTSSTALNPPSLISQQVGSNLTLQGVIGLGRVNFSSGKIVSNITGKFLGLDDSSINSGTFTKLDGCFLDGFAVPIDLSSNLSSDGYQQDFLEIKDCKIRAYGYFNGDSIDGYNNTIIKSDVQNINISGSIFYSNDINVNSSVYLTYPPNPAPALQDRSKIIIVGNQIIIDKANNDNTFNSTWIPIYLSPSITSPLNVFTSLIYGNVFQDTFSIYVDSGYNYSGSGLGQPNISIAGTSVSVNTNTFFAVNGTCDLNGNVNIDQVATIQGSSAALIIEAGANLNIDSTAISNITSGASSTIIMKAGSTFDGYVGSFLNLDGYVTFNTYTTSSSYICDTSAVHASDFLILVDTSSSANTITLPTAIGINKGRILVIKDSTGYAFSHNISVHAKSGEFIDFGSASINIITDFGFYALISNGVGWYIISKG